VAPPGSEAPEIILMVPGPPYMDDGAAKQLLELVASGAFMATGILATEDRRADFAVLKARGVEFQQEPMERDYGIDAAFRDPSGNSWRMTQRA